ncbi:expressed unknown protein (Partial), partial [Seminavis robusta]|eukprot:Sro4084_g352790.1 n/a (79) ;mRNA; r:2-239
MVVGNHTVMAEAFDRLGVHKFEVSRDSYPELLRPYLKRPVWRTIVKQLKRAARDNGQFLPQPLFVKPYDSRSFTGCMVA